MPSLKEQISIIDESYLIGISNRGIVNRAQKDLAGSEVNLSLNNTMLEAAFADGTVVKITGMPGQFECSCPSRTICKHVVMALIKASESIGGKEEQTTVSSGSFD